MHAHEFSALIPECCSEVLDSMYFTSVLGAVISPGIRPEQVRSGDGSAFTLHYSGHCAGQFGVYVPDAVARTLAANFLGEDELSLPQEDVAAVIGELSNMLCGSVMSCATRDIKFALSHPMPLVSPAELTSEDALAVELETDLGTIVVWIAVEGVPCLS